MDHIGLLTIEQTEYPWPYDKIWLLTADQAIYNVHISTAQVMMNTLDHMTKVGCWPLTELYLWPGHDGYPWPYDHIGLLTIDQTVMYTFD